jgi:hypothetical protein
MENLRTGERIAGIAGVALLIIMFLNWWGAPEIEIEGLGTVGGTGTANAWEAADVLDILWALAAISGIALALMAATSSQVNMPVAMSAITAGLGGLATLFILYRIIDPPFDADREYGVFLGLVAAAGITYGGWVAMQEEGTTFSAQADRLTDRDDAPPPPPPPPAAPPPSSGGPAA